ncbi:glycosyltransferase family 2 protein [Enterococcus durans]|uniref:glycosyltransferase family 2 protein n=1 Tax=Enterococcus durans TaxID=53345 RepID=UPI0022E7BFDB|nr:glycosyltransferase family 2 protein [Enterococcus durans]MDB1654216.1 glycosyltransferase family 2 protein [Enterococcus durans]MDB1656837.1 glycosyltransferase family 2 protein [Enterococcus durans]MDB1664905.1 glycosyltransferase family 2 protein [Enterococcus durans]MDB1670161.1 glycosyltransferase family 2 protein [Enterococcus durans]MDB1671486.1 glycosyltransferase family 2 protein [Enterococcus durans]
MKKNLENSIKLSIIIPFYNAKKTLERAIDSVFSQEYKNIEILLIDDGSTDGSDEICAKIVKDRKNIFYYAIEKGGVSAARNIGLEKASGDVIGFLDSDDYYLSGCFHKVLADFCQNNPDIVAFGLKKGTSEENSLRLIPQKNIALNNREGVEQLFRDKAVDFYLWNKFFKRELFSQITFPEGKLYEDMVPTYEAFKMALKIDILDFEGIFYYQNNESIVYQTFNKNQYDNVTQRKILLKKVTKDFPELLSLAKSRLIDGYLSTGFKISKENLNQGIPKEYYVKSVKEIKTFSKEIKNEKEVSFLKKIALKLYTISPKAYFILYKNYLGK